MLTFTDKCSSTGPSPLHGERGVSRNTPSAALLPLQQLRTQAVLTVWFCMYVKGHSSRFENPFVEVQGQSEHVTEAPPSLEKGAEGHREKAETSPEVGAPLIGIRNGSGWPSSPTSSLQSAQGGPC